MSAPPRKASSTKTARPGSGRPAGITRTSSTESQPIEIFNAKASIEFLAAQVQLAQASGKAVVYQGEQRAWGGTRAFNPVKDDFLQLVEIAIDACRQDK